MTAPEDLAVEVLDEPEGVLEPAAIEALGRFAQRLLATLRREDDAVEPALSILVTDDAGIRPLNARWRRKDAATDVLSFPLRDGGTLGDVAISVETAAARLGAQTWSLHEELAFLLLHGVLHLLGHDHEEPAERAAMEAEEQRLWTALGMAGTLRAPAPDGVPPRAGPGAA